jgi:hypothetical protein
MQFQNTPLKRGKNAGKWTVSYYCRNDDCIRHNKEEQQKQGLKLAKSIRAKYVLAAIEWELRHATRKSKKAYELYIHSLETKLATERAITARKQHEAEQQLKLNEQRLVKYSDLHVEDREAYERYHKGKIELHEEKIANAKLSIEDNRNRLNDLKTALPTEEEFYELINLHLLDMLQTNDIMKLEAICDELVTNLRAGNDSTPVIKLNPPYDLMVDLDKVTIGREQPTVLELYNFIIETSDHYSNLCEELEAIRTYQPKDEALVML